MHSTGRPNRKYILLQASTRVFIFLHSWLAARIPPPRPFPARALPYRYSWQNKWGRAHPAIEIFLTEHVCVRATHFVRSIPHFIRGERHRKQGHGSRWKENRQDSVQPHFTPSLFSLVSPAALEHCLLSPQLLMAARKEGREGLTIAQSFTHFFHYCDIGPCHVGPR